MTTFATKLGATQVIQYANEIFKRYTWAKDLDDFDANFTDIDHSIQSLEKMIFHTAANIKIQQLATLDKHFLSEMHRIYCFWETTMERRFVRSILEEGSCTLSKYPLYQRFERLLRRETSMIQADRTKKALFIGSGPVPVSAIWYQQLTGMNVDCFDIDERAVGLSKILLNTIGLERKIQVFHQPDNSYDVSDYAIIMIALLAKPKLAILHNIHNTASDDCQIICRTSEAGRRILYEPLIIDTVNQSGFEIADAQFINSFADDVISSFKLQKL